MTYSPTEKQIEAAVAAHYEHWGHSPEDDDETTSHYQAPYREAIVRGLIAAHAVAERPSVEDLDRTICDLIDTIADIVAGNHAGKSVAFIFSMMAVHTIALRDLFVKARES